MGRGEPRLAANESGCQSPFRRASARQLTDVARAYGEFFRKLTSVGSGLTAATLAAASAVPDHLPDDDIEELRQVLYGEHAAVAVRKQQAVWDYLYDAPINDEIVKRRAAINELLNERGSAQPRAHTLIEVSPPHDPRILVRGNPTRPGKHVPRQFLHVRLGLRSQIRLVPSGAAGLGAGHRHARQSADGAGAGQSRLDSSFRRGTGPHAEQFRSAWPNADPSRIARLSGGTLYGRRLVDQEAAPLDHAVQRLSAKQPRHAEFPCGAIRKIDCCGK